MKKVYIKFINQYGKEDYEDGALLYGYKYNILCIDNVVEVFIPNIGLGGVSIIYKDTSRSKKTKNINLYLKDIKDMTIN